MFDYLSYRLLKNYEKEEADFDQLFGLVFEDEKPSEKEKENLSIPPPKPLGNKVCDPFMKTQQQRSKEVKTLGLEQKPILRKNDISTLNKKKLPQGLKKSSEENKRALEVVYSEEEPKIAKKKPQLRKGELKASVEKTDTRDCTDVESVN